MKSFFKLPVLVEPDRIRFIRFATEAVTHLGGSVFAAGPTMVGLLSMLRDHCGRSEGAVNAELAVDGERLLATCADGSILLCNLPQPPDAQTLTALSERLHESSDSTDPELLKRRNQKIREDLERFVARSEQQKAAIESELARKKRELQRSIQLSETDSLTGLLNRGAFDRRLQEALTRAQRQREPLSLALLDLDNFKDVNDTYGHQHGDAYLQRLAEALRQAAREGVDQLFRIGGDEFAAIVFATRDVAERIGKDVLELMEGKVSVGVAGLRLEDMPETLVARADKALYAAKRAGRGRVRGERETAGSGGLGARLAEPTVVN